MIQENIKVREIIKQALIEDIGNGDHSSLACVPMSSFGEMKLLAKEEGILAGIDIAELIVQEVDPDIRMTKYMKDGDNLKKGKIVFCLQGNAQSMLSAERLLLNFMQRMSGIATKTRHYVEAIAGTSAKILDTRKTTPGLRIFEKYAVKVGGAENHRFGLFDMIMLKDNHIDFAGGIENAISQTHRYLKKHQLNLKIEIETRNLEEVKQVLKKGGIDRIMLDNFTPELLKDAIRLIDKQYETEASGGITLSNIGSYAQSGVDYISIGALTHHIKSLDMSLKFSNRTN
jgi:nicotinate-nucleotide pyrophosphorylase (carboxylating)